MQTQLNIAGYELIEISHDRWMFHAIGEYDYQGTFKQVLTHAVETGFKLNNLDEAITEMVRKEHDAAHFGINKTLIFTYNKDQYDTKTS